MATALALLLGFLKALPQVLDLYKAIKENADAVASQLAAQKAVNNYETKKQSTVDFIKLHTDKLRRDTEAITEGQLQVQQQPTVEGTISNGVDGNSSKVS